MSNNLVECRRCKGTGHDKAGRPEIKMVMKRGDNGKMVKKHTTIKQGSGCLNCLGRGFLSAGNQS